ncbi:MAG: serine/threonine protein kinase, partial [Bdellovibrionales bacterium]|nr:serine/threonine protein kinase [Bdellovibrionales bacterium]
MSDTATYVMERPALASRFRVLDTLGEGAGSRVYLVEDTHRNGQHVALKVLEDHQAFDEHTRERFTREMEVCRQIRHPNLVEAYDLIPLENTVAFTMEFVRGKDLAHYFYLPDRLPAREIDRMFIAILLALEELHLHGIVHRDLKLENVLVRDDGAIKLSDLGLMKKLDSEGLTRPGILLGTVHYMPPEYIKHGKYDARSDLYSVAIMLMEMLTGRRRLEGFEGREVIAELVRTKFEISGALLQTLPKKYRVILEKGSARDPSKRYQSASEMRADFERDHSEFVGMGTTEISSNLGMKSTALRNQHCFSCVHEMKPVTI